MFYEHVLKNIDPEIHVTHVEEPSTDAFQSLTLNTKRDSNFAATFMHEIQSRYNYALGEIKKQNQSLEHILIAIPRFSWEAETDIYHSQHTHRSYL